MKKGKTPRIFRKAYKPKTFERKIVRRIHIPSDREYIKSLFEEDDRGRMRIIDDLPDDSGQKLKTLGKAVKKNKGLFTTWKVALVLIPLASIFLFYIVFRNRIAEKGAERALENIFVAQVDFSGMDLSILKGGVSFDSLTIADRDNPFSNLVETGSGRIRIDLSELFFKRLRIDEISLHDVRWNTERYTDGSLPESGGENREAPTPRGDSESDASGFSAADLIGEIDYGDLIEKQKDNLKSPVLIQTANEAMGSFASDWTGRFDEKQKEIEALKKEISSLKAVDSATLTDPAEIQALLTSITSLKDKAQSVGGDVKDMNSDFQIRKENLVLSGSDLVSSIEGDLAYLGNAFSFGGGGFQSLASDLAADYIRARWGRFYKALERGLTVYRRFNDRDDKVEQKREKGLSRDRGRTVLFPSSGKPGFFLGELALSGMNANGSYDALATSITSDPDAVSEPVSVFFSYEKGSYLVDGRGRLDLSSDRKEMLMLSIEGRGIPVLLEEGIPALGLDGFSSIAGLSGEIRSGREPEPVEAVFLIQLSDMDFRESGSGGLLGDRVGTLIEQREAVSLDGSLSAGGGQIHSLEMSSDFDKALSDSVGDLLSQMEDEALTALENELKDFLGPSMDKNELLSSGLDALGVKSAGQIAAVDSLEEELDRKRRELEAKAASLLENLNIDSGGILDKAKEGLKLPGF